MKKLLYVISAVALMASFASCNKIEQENAPAADGATFTVSATVPQTKTYFNSGQVKWVAGDVITVFASDGTSVRSDAVFGSAVGTYDFTVTGWDPSKTPLYALAAGPETYYTSYYDGVSYIDGVIRAKLRPDQALYQRNSFGKYANIAVGELQSGAESGVYSTIMRNLCGLIRFKVEGNYTVKKVVIKDKNGKAMTGEVDMEMTQEGDMLVPTVKNVIKGTPSVTITAISSASLNDNTGKLPPGDIYACVLPGTYTPVIEVYGEGETDSDDDDVLLNTLTAASEMTVTRNKYESIDVYVDTYKPSQGGDDPVTPDPAETLILTLDFATQPFTTNIATAASKESATFTLVQDEVSYQFIIGSPEKGFYYNSNCLRLVHGGTASAPNYGYIKLPGLEGFTLSSINITSSNSINRKEYHVFDEDPTVTSSESVHTFALNNENPVDVDLTGKIAAGKGCYLAALGNNTQFSKLVLTYTKVN